MLYTEFKNNNMEVETTSSYDQTTKKGSKNRNLRSIKKLASLIIQPVRKLSSLLGIFSIRGCSKNAGNSVLESFQLHQEASLCTIRQLQIASIFVALTFVALRQQRRYHRKRSLPVLVVEAESM